MPKTQIVLGATAMEITREPIADNVTELIPKGQIASVIPLSFIKKPSHATLFYSGISSGASIGDTIMGVTSGATGVIAGFIGTSGFNLVDVVGQFEKDEPLTINGSFSWAGTAAATGPFNGVSGTTSGSGTGATFDVSDASGSGTYDTVTVDTPGSGYQVGDTITILGTDLGGATPANDLVITITGDTATASKDSEPTEADNFWKYRYPTITQININQYDEEVFNIDLQDVSNQPTWSTGDLAGINAAVAAINAWLP